MAANVKWETLSDLAHKGWDVGVRCRCGHQATIDAKALLRRFQANNWDMRAGFIREHLTCSKCGKRPFRVGISGDHGRAKPVSGPLTLDGMRAQGIRCVNVDCTCRGPHEVNVDHLPGSLPVPAVQFRVKCPCGRKPLRTMPNWIERGAVIGTPG